MKTYEQVPHDIEMDVNSNQPHDHEKAIELFKFTLIFQGIVFEYIKQLHHLNINVL